MVSLTNNRIASCSYDKTIKIWNTKNSYNLVTKLSGHNNYVISIIQLKGKEILIFVSRDNTLRKWNLSTYHCDKIINQVYCSCTSNNMLEIEHNRVIIGGYKEITVVNIFNDNIEQKNEIDKVVFIDSLLQLRNCNVVVIMD